MEKILDFLKELNLSDIEAKIYLTLLEYGPASVRDIAQNIGLKRTTAYLYIENLMKKGLASKNVLNSRSLIFPIQPNEGLTALVTETEANTKNIEGKLSEVIETIHSFFPSFKEVEQFEIKHYQNISGIKKIYEEAFQANELRTYIKLEEHDPVFPDNVIMFDKAFKNNPNLHVQEILYKSSIASSEAQQIVSAHPQYSYKFMPEGMKLTSEDILIFDGRVAIIHYKNRENSNCIVLQSDDYYRNSVEFFDFIWKMLPEEKK
ncbi:MAG TPA: helix-turn-helix domain-containing protein [Candidatus Saccharimonadales bacterium]|nr:helix-turn-helix domain-containing protein [Candidatus Saccharimonadales bacterium]